MRTATVSLFVAIILALCAPCIAFAASNGLQAGNTIVVEQEAGENPSTAVLSKFTSGAAGKVYAAAASADDVAGYQFQIARDKRFRIGLKEKTVKSDTATFMGLTGKKSYYGRVRAFAVVEGKAVWGPWSAIKSAKVTQAVIGVARGGTAGAAKRWIRRGGAKVVTINTAKVNPARYDGLVLPGGGDIDPALYGKKRNSHCFGIDRKLDEFQIGVALKFAKAGKPVIGLCRGVQVINVAFGGTLYQHINGWHIGSRKVKIAKGSWLYSMFGATETTSHSHHQCALKLGQGLKATQWDARDKHIEALEHTEYPVYGLQWHPERMGARGTAIAKKFVRVCSKYSTPRKAA